MNKMARSYHLISMLTLLLSVVLVTLPSQASALTPPISAKIKSQPKCKEKYTCGMLRDCCSADSECFSGCCDQMLGMCTDIEVCSKLAHYSVPPPSPSPLFNYLRDQTSKKMNPIQALANVEELLDKKQCYTYALILGSKTYQYNRDTQQFKIPTDEDYEYNEKSLLRGQNLGYFGIGVPVKLGSYQSKKSPYSYDYYTDYSQVRFKAVDEYFNRVNKDADNNYTYGGNTYYYYYSYYTYKAGSNYWTDSYTYSGQDGKACYQYSRNQGNGYKSAYTCEDKGLPYKIGHKQFNGTLAALIFCGIILSVWVFGCCEIRVHKVRDYKIDKNIDASIRKGITRLERIQGEVQQWERSQLIANGGRQGIVGVPVVQAPSVLLEQQQHNHTGNISSDNEQIVRNQSQMTEQKMVDKAKGF